MAKPDISKLERTRHFYLVLTSEDRVTGYPDTEIIPEAQTRIDRIERPSHFDLRPVLVQVNGVTEGVARSDFFAEIIDFGSLLSPVPR